MIWMLWFAIFGEVTIRNNVRFTGFLGGNYVNRSIRVDWSSVIFVSSMTPSLQKQVWHLLHDTSSLFYHVFKAKFFPHGTILDCHTTTRGSYAWQSILKVRQVIARGAVWKVGNGQSINIWIKDGS